MAHGSQHSDLYMLRLLGPVLVAVAPHGRRAPLGLPAEEVVHVLVEHGLRCDSGAALRESAGGGSLTVALAPAAYGT